MTRRVVFGQNEHDLRHAQAVERHSSRAVGLIQVSARRQRRAAIEYTNIVEREESAGEYVASLWIFAVDPPGAVLTFHRPPRQQMGDGVQQNIGPFALGEKTVYKLQTAGLIRSRRHDEDWHLRLEPFHLPGDLGTRLARQEVVGNHQLDGVLFEKLESVFAGRCREDRIAGIGQQKFANAQGHFRVINTEDERPL